MRVKGWSKNVELFYKDMTIIYEHSHWYQVIVKEPGPIINAPGRATRRLKGETFFIVLDSLGKSQNEAVTNIMSYLGLE